jgi:hypothetical protein
MFVGALLTVRLHREQEAKEKEQLLNKPKTCMLLSAILLPDSFPDNTYNPNPFRAKWKKEKTYMTAAEIEVFYDCSSFALLD